MIPILYEANETEFGSNGLGRLRDCISCKVTEERNGVYECDFEYPVDGSNYNLIRLGRIIAVEHDETNDVQPFDIVSYSRPINGVVSFHAVHISYRQSKLTASGTNITSLADAFTMLGTSTPDNPFDYWTDKTSEGYMSAADGTPYSVRQLLGGIEGSILDTYGGEYEWDKWTVRLWASRGRERNFTVRYGVNMLDYKDETDYSESYNAMVPYWKGNDNAGNTLIVKGAMVSSGVNSNSGRTECVPFDFTDKFESQPTASQLEVLADAYMQSAQPYLPAQTISVDFIRLADSPEYQQFAQLQECKLCDTIRVIFPNYKQAGYFKIVKTEYDVLLERFTTLELGSLSTSLAEALGVGTGSSGSATETVVTDYVKEFGTKGVWSYRKWNSGKTEAWCTYSFASASWTVWTSPIRYMDKTINIPDGIFSDTPNVTVTSASNQYWVVGCTATASTTASLRLATVASSAMATAVKIYAYTN